MKQRSSSVMARDNRVPLILAVLLVATFLFGGGSRGDITSLVILRPLSIGCLAYGCYAFTADRWTFHRGPLLLMAAICAFIALHLIPLPPVVWHALPGRAIVEEADAIAGIEGAWRPLSLVPYRGWNALWAMGVPAAAMVLAVQIKPEQHWLVLRLILGLAVASALLGLLQAISGSNPVLYPYRVTNLEAPVGLFANRNHQAALMCIAIPMLALTATTARGSNRMIIQVLCGALGLAFALVTLATGSRAGLGFLLLSAATAAVVLRHVGERRKERTKRKLWLVPAVLGGGTLLATAAVAIIFSRARSIERVIQSDQVEESRLQVWRVIAELLPSYQPVGSGIGSFVEVFSMAEPSDMLSLAYWNHAHNDWLEWLLEGGIPALALMAAAIFLWARAARRIWRRLSSADAQVLLSLTGASTILILGLWSLVDYPLRVPALAALVGVAAIWMTLPGSVAGGRLGANRGNPEERAGA